MNEKLKFISPESNSFSMGINYAEILKKSLKFAIQPKRWAPFFVLDFVFLSIVIIYTLTNIADVISLMMVPNDITLLASLVPYFSAILALFASWMLIRFWITGAIIHQSNKENEYKKSFTYSAKKYPAILAVMIIMGILGFATSVIPYVGWLLSIIVSLMFFFAIQVVIVNNKSFSEGLSKSYNIFRKNAFNVLLSWLLLAIISIAIMIIFALPMFALFFNVAQLSSTAVSQETLASYIIGLSQAYLPVLLIVGACLVVGIAISTVFSLKAQTEIFMKVKK